MALYRNIVRDLRDLAKGLDPQRRGGLERHAGEVEALVKTHEELLDRASKMEVILAEVAVLQSALKKFGELDTRVRLNGR